MGWPLSFITQVVVFTVFSLAVAAGALECPPDPSRGLGTGKQVRYVSLATSMNVAMNYMELQVFVGTTNVALGKPATMRPYDPGGTAGALCVDGDAATMCHSSYNAIATPNNNPLASFWLDLQGTFDVTSVSLINRPTVSFRSLHTVMHLLDRSRRVVDSFLLTGDSGTQTFDTTHVHDQLPSVVVFQSYSLSTTHVSELEVFSISNTNLATGQATRHVVISAESTSVAAPMVDGNTGTHVAIAGLGSVEVTLGSGARGATERVVVRNTAGTHAVMAGGRVFILDQQRRIINKFIHGGAAVETFHRTFRTVTEPRPIAAIVIRAAQWEEPLSIAEVEAIDSSGVNRALGGTVTGSGTATSPFANAVDGDKFSAAVRAANLDGVPWLRIGVATANLTDLVAVRIATSSAVSPDMLIFGHVDIVDDRARVVKTYQFGKRYRHCFAATDAEHTRWCVQPKVRYVLIHQHVNMALHPQEVEVATRDEDNIAVNKPIDLLEFYPPHPGSFCNDGNFATQCHSTWLKIGVPENLPPTVLALDLGAEYDIESFAFLFSSNLYRTAQAMVTLADARHHAIGRYLLRGEFRTQAFFTSVALDTPRPPTEAPRDVRTFGVVMYSRGRAWLSELIAVDETNANAALGGQAFFIGSHYNYKVARPTLIDSNLGTHATGNSADPFGGFEVELNAARSDLKELRVHNHYSGTPGKAADMQGSRLYALDSNRRIVADFVLGTSTDQTFSLKEPMPTSGSPDDIPVAGVIYIASSWSWPLRIGEVEAWTSDLEANAALGTTSFVTYHGVTKSLANAFNGKEEDDMELAFAGYPGLMFFRATFPAAANVRALRMILPSSGNSSRTNYGRMDWLAVSGRILESSVFDTVRGLCWARTASSSDVGLCATTAAAPQEGGPVSGSSTGSPVRYLVFHSHVNMAVNFKELQVFDTNGNDVAVGVRGDFVEPYQDSGKACVDGVVDGGPVCHSEWRHLQSPPKSVWTHPDHLPPTAFYIDLGREHNITRFSAWAYDNRVLRQGNMVLGLYREDRARATHEYVFSGASYQQTFFVNSVPTEPASQLQKNVANIVFMTTMQKPAVLSEVQVVTAGGTNVASTATATSVPRDSASWSTPNAAPAIIDGNPATHHTGTTNFGSFEVFLAAPRSDIASITVTNNAGSHADLDGGRVFALDANRRVLASFATRGVASQTFALQSAHTGEDNQAVRLVLRATRWNVVFRVATLKLIGADGRQLLTAAGATKSPHTVTRALANAVDDDATTWMQLEVTNYVGLPFVSFDIDAAAVVASGGIAALQVQLPSPELEKNGAWNRVELVDVNGRILRNILLEEQHAQCIVLNETAAGTPEAAAMLCDTAGQFKPRYVAVHNNWDIALHPAEIKIMDRFGHNLALNKDVFQLEPNPGSAPSRAVDGDIGTSSHSLVGVLPSALVVDLGKEYDVSSFFIYGGSTQTKRAQFVSMTFYDGNARAMQRVLLQRAQFVSGFLDRRTTVPLSSRLNVSATNAKFIGFYSPRKTAISVAELEAHNSGGTNVAAAGAAACHGPDYTNGADTAYPIRTCPAINDGNPGTSHTMHEAMAGVEITLSGTHDNIVALRLRAASSAAASNYDGGRVYVLDSQRRVIAEWMTTTSADQTFSMTESAGTAAEVPVASIHLRAAHINQFSIATIALLKNGVDAARGSAVRSGHPTTYPLSLTVDGDTTTVAQLNYATQPALPYVIADISTATVGAEFLDVISPTDRTTEFNMQHTRVDLIAASGRVTDGFLITQDKNLPRRFALTAPPLADSTGRVTAPPPLEPTTSESSKTELFKEGLSEAEMNARDPSLVRYVVLHHHWNMALNLMEVEVYSGSTNVARQGVADMVNHDGTNVPSRCIDGDIATFCHSAQPPPAPLNPVSGLSIDLKTPTNVTSVRVFNRPGQLQRSAMMTVSLLNSARRTVHEFMLRGHVAAETLLVSNEDKAIPSAASTVDNVKFIGLLQLNYVKPQLEEFRAFTSGGTNVALAGTAHVYHPNQPRIVAPSINNGATGDTVVSAYEFGGFEVSLAAVSDIVRLETVIANAKRTDLDGAHVYALDSNRRIVAQFLAKPLASQSFVMAEPTAAAPASSEDVPVASIHLRAAHWGATLPIAEVQAVSAAGDNAAASATVTTGTATTAPASNLIDDDLTTSTAFDATARTSIPWITIALAAPTVLSSVRVVQPGDGPFRPWWLGRVEWVASTGRVLRSDIIDEVHGMCFALSASNEQKEGVLAASMRVEQQCGLQLSPAPESKKELVRQRVRYIVIRTHWFLALDPTEVRLVTPHGSLLSPASAELRDHRPGNEPCFCFDGDSATMSHSLNRQAPPWANPTAALAVDLGAAMPIGQVSIDGRATLKSRLHGASVELYNEAREMVVETHPYGVEVSNLFMFGWSNAPVKYVGVRTHTAETLSVAELEVWGGGVNVAASGVAIAASRSGPHVSAAAAIDGNTGTTATTVNEMGAVEVALSTTRRDVTHVVVTTTTAAAADLDGGTVYLLDVNRRVIDRIATAGLASQTLPVSEPLREIADRVTTAQIVVTAVSSLYPARVAEIMVNADAPGALASSTVRSKQSAVSGELFPAAVDGDNATVAGMDATQVATPWLAVTFSVPRSVYRICVVPPEHKPSIDLRWGRIDWTAPSGRIMKTSLLLADGTGTADCVGEEIGATPTQQISLSTTSTAAVTMSRSVHRTESVTAALSVSSSVVSSRTSSLRPSLTSTQHLTASVTHSGSLSLRTQTHTHVQTGSRSLMATATSTMPQTSTTSVSSSSSLVGSQSKSTSLSLPVTTSLSQSSSRVPSPSTTLFATTTQSGHSTITSSQSTSGSVVQTLSNSAVQSRSNSIAQTTSFTKPATLTQSLIGSTTVSLSSSHSASMTSSSTVPYSQSASVMQTSSWTATRSFAATASITTMNTLTATAVPSRSFSWSGSVSVVATPSNTAMRTSTVSTSQSASASSPRTASSSLPVTPSQSAMHSTTVSKNASHSAVVTMTNSLLATRTNSALLTRSATVTHSSAATVSHTTANSATATNVPTPSATQSATVSVVASRSSTVQGSTTRTNTYTGSTSVSSSVSLVIPDTRSVTSTVTPSETHTLHRSATTSLTSSLIASWTASNIRSQSTTPAATTTPTLTSNVSKSPPPSVTKTPGETPGVTATASPTVTPALTRTHTALKTQSMSRINTVSRSTELPKTATSTAVATSTASGAPTASTTAVLSQTASHSSVPTKTGGSPTSTATRGRTVTVSNGATASVSTSNTPSVTPSIAPSTSATRAPTASVTPTLSQVLPPTGSSTKTASRVAAPSVSPPITRLPSPTKTIDATPTRQASASSSSTLSNGLSTTASIPATATPSVHPTTSLALTTTRTNDTSESTMASSGNTSLRDSSSSLLNASSSYSSHGSSASSSSIASNGNTSSVGPVGTVAPAPTPVKRSLSGVFNTVFAPESCGVRTSALAATLTVGSLLLVLVAAGVGFLVRRLHSTSSIPTSASNQRLKGMKDEGGSTMGGTAVKRSGPVDGPSSGEDTLGPSTDAPTILRGSGGGSSAPTTSPNAQVTSTAEGSGSSSSVPQAQRHFSIGGRSWEVLPTGGFDMLLRRHAWIGALWPCTTHCAPEHVTVFVTRVAAAVLVCALLVDTAMAHVAISTGGAAAFCLCVGLTASLGATTVQPIIEIGFRLARKVRLEGRFSERRRWGSEAQDLLKFGTQPLGFIGLTADTYGRLDHLDFADCEDNEFAASPPPRAGIYHPASKPRPEEEESSSEEPGSSLRNPRASEAVLSDSAVDVDQQRSPRAAPDTIMGRSGRGSAFAGTGSSGDSCLDVEPVLPSTSTEVFGPGGRSFRRRESTRSSDYATVSRRFRTLHPADLKRRHAIYRMRELRCRREKAIAYASCALTILVMALAAAFVSLPWCPDVEPHRWRTFGWAVLAFAFVDVIAVQPLLCALVALRLWLLFDGSTTEIVAADATMRCGCSPRHGGCHHDSGTATATDDPSATASSLPVGDPSTVGVRTGSSSTAHGRSERKQSSLRHRWLVLEAHPVDGFVVETTST